MGKCYDMGQNLTKDEMVACEAAKVTSTLPKSATMEVDDKDPGQDPEKDEP